MEAEVKYVGVDVSKARLDVGLWPAGEYFSVSNDAQGIAQLGERMLQLRPSAVELEATGGLESLAACELHAAGQLVAGAHPRQVPGFSSPEGGFGSTERLALPTVRPISTTAHTTR